MLLGDQWTLLEGSWGTMGKHSALNTAARRLIAHSSGACDKSSERNMAIRTVDNSPRLYARIAGILYLYIFVAGTFAQLFVRSTLVVSTDAEATAKNIIANETLFRIGFSGELLHLVFDVIVAVIFYGLFKSIDRHIALIAAFMRLSCDIILAVASLSHFVALKLLSNADYLNTIPSDQLHTLALLAMKLHGDTYAISLIFFSFACLSLGYLIFISRYLPKAIGILMIVAGILYFVISITHFLNPELSATITSTLFVPIFIAEFALTMWLIVKGVNTEIWERNNSQISKGDA